MKQPAIISSIKKVLERIDSALQHKNRHTLVDELKSIGYEIKNSHYPDIVLTDNLDNFHFRKNRHTPLPVVNSESAHQVVLNFLQALNKEAYKRNSYKNPSVINFPNLISSDAFRRIHLGPRRKQIGSILYESCCIEEVFFQKDILLDELILESYWKFLDGLDAKVYIPSYMGGTIRINNQLPMNTNHSSLTKESNHSFKSQNIRSSIPFERYKYRSNIQIESSSVDSEIYLSPVKDIIVNALLDNQKVGAEIIDVSSLADMNKFPFENLFLTEVDEENQYSDVFRFLIHGYT